MASFSVSMWEFRGCNPIYASKLVNLPSSYKKRQWYWVITVIFRLSCSCNNCQKRKVCFLKMLQKVSEKSEHQFSVKIGGGKIKQNTSTVSFGKPSSLRHIQNYSFSWYILIQRFPLLEKWPIFSPLDGVFFVKGPFFLWNRKVPRSQPKNYASAVTNTHSCLFLRPLTFFIS